MSTSKPSVHGFLNLYKPPRITSMEAVRQARNLTGQRRVGHGGTLDPVAEGVLPICFGQATRLMEYLVDSVKHYRMTVYLGISTDTYDSEGTVTSRRDPSGVTLADVEAALQQFQGIFEQVPPMYSALKKGGQRLYELARKGLEVEREPRKVEIKRIEVVEFRPPEVVLDVESGRGAYMRSLAHDLGEALGCGGHLANLVRRRSGPFHIEDAVSLEELKTACREDTWQALLKPIDFVVLHMKAITVGRSAEKLIRNGQAVDLGAASLYASHMESYRAYNAQGQFLGILRLDKARGLWKPYKIFQLDTPPLNALKA